jgi:hypothetical protein
MRHSSAVHHTIVVTDTENFTDPARTNLDQLAVRHGLYQTLRYAFGIHWSVCRTEDRGDGVLILVPSGVPKIHVVTRVLTHLDIALSRYNASCPARAGIRLRVAVHAGEVHHDRHGVAGTAINHAFRLVETHVFKAAFDATTGLLAVIVSDWFYDEVVRHYPAADPDSYRRVGAAWVRLVGSPVCGPGPRTW